MRTVSNLSPLAFEVLKYLCNTRDSGEYRSMDKNTLSIGAQADFLNALEELQQAGLVDLSRDATYIQHTNPEDIITQTMTHLEQPDNMEPISVKIAGDQDDVCKAMDNYLKAGLDQ